ncbi:hypothetical protein PanWU01x14_368610, partial [Parasponia andersonii]
NWWLESIRENSKEVGLVTLGGAQHRTIVKHRFLASKGQDFVDFFPCSGSSMSYDGYQ